MDCTRCRDHLNDLIDGRLAPEIEAEVRSALEVCPECREELATLESMVRGLGDLPRVEAPAGLGERLRVAFREEVARSEAPATAPEPGLLARLGAFRIAAGLAAMLFGALALSRELDSEPPAAEGLVAERQNAGAERPESARRSEVEMRPMEKTRRSEWYGEASASRDGEAEGALEEEESESAATPDPAMRKRARAGAAVAAPRSVSESELLDLVEATLRDELRRSEAAGNRLVIDRGLLSLAEDRDDRDLKALEEQLGRSARRFDGFVDAAPRRSSDLAAEKDAGRAVSRVYLCSGPEARSLILAEARALEATPRERPVDLLGTTEQRRTKEAPGAGQGGRRETAPSPEPEVAGEPARELAPGAGVEAAKGAPRATGNVIELRLGVSEASRLVERLGERAGLRLVLLASELAPSPVRARAGDDEGGVTLQFLLPVPPAR